MVDASNREVINGKWILVQLIPERYQMNNPVKSAVRNNLTVESTIPGERLGRIYLNLVSIPQANRMTLRATIPTNWAILAL